MYKSKHTGETIDNSIDLMQYVSNPNLLDNWYFLNPVNQRGQTEHVGNDYHVDRWRGAYTSDVTTITERGLTVKNMRSSGNTFFRQYFENPLEDGVYTLSVLMADAVDATVYLYTTNGQLVGQQVSLTGGMNTVTVEVFGDSVNRVQFTLRDGGLITIVAIKLELGSQQTLAHQDEDGNWVLNEIPDYGEQLLRCQRYFQIYSAADKRPAKAVDCRPTMRANPSQGTIAIGGTTYYYNTAEL